MTSSSAGLLALARACRTADRSTLSRVARPGSRSSLARSSTLRSNVSATSSSSSHGEILAAAIWASSRTLSFRWSRRSGVGSSPTSAGTRSAASRSCRNGTGARASLGAPVRTVRSAASSFLRNATSSSMEGPLFVSCFVSLPCGKSSARRTMALTAPHTGTFQSSSLALSTALATSRRAAAPRSTSPSRSSAGRRRAQWSALL
mmetsp:Transcript_66398/g.188527  ORF Transcript_66398/g.188527 Transcript_66398/m.188527 type:complete len:204 (-) Transcript_66398:1021-1632(-)